MTTSRAVLIGLLALTLVRIIIGAFSELSADEAYYFLWSQHLAPSYYSKGPGIAWAIKAGTTIFGDTSLGIRILSPLLGLATSLVFYRLGRALFSEQTAAWAVLLLNLTPIFNAGSIVMTIDPISIFFWTTATLTLWRALHRANPLNLYWPLTGLLIGLGFLAKYTNAFQLLSIILLLVVSRRWRGQLKKPGLYLLLLVFALCTIPVFVWNAQHEWITFTHLKERGSLDQAPGFNPLNFLTFFAGHFFTYSPLIFAGLVWALILAAVRFGKDDSETFLFFFAAPIIAVYFILSFNQAGELNWTAPGFITAGLLLPHFWQQAKLSGRLKRNLRSATLALGGLMSLLMMNTDLARQVGAPWPYAYDFQSRLRGWKESSAYLDDAVRAAANSLDSDVFLIGNKYQTAAIHGFYLDDDAPIIQPTPAHPKIHIVESATIQNQFSFWPRYDGLEFTGNPGDEPSSPFIGKHALFITDNAKAINPPQNIQRGFESWELSGVIDIVRRDDLVRRLKIFTCYNYQGLPL
ncbi:MAG: glycosyltransferase family 39 protein [Verrucomicrobiota bacterium]